MDFKKVRTVLFFDVPGSFPTSVKLCNLVTIIRSEGATKKDTPRLFFAREFLPNEQLVFPIHNYLKPLPLLL